MAELDLQRNERQLFVIGNGFDLMHGMHTSWIDFQEWWLGQLCPAKSPVINILNDRGLKNASDLIEAVETDLEGLYQSNDESEIAEALFFDICRCALEHSQFQSSKEINILWSDFEKILVSLSLPDPDVWVESADVEWEWRDAGLRENQAIMISGVLNLSERIRDWLGSVSLTNFRYRVLQEVLESADLLLTFNYTDTVERVYGREAFHIHGSLSTPDKLILGCASHPDETSASLSMAYDVLNAEYHHSLEKTPQVGALVEFLGGASLKSVSTLGFSFGEVDWPYVEQIIKHTGDETEWIAYIYQESDAVLISELLNRYGYSGVLSIRRTNELTS